MTDEPIEDVEVVDDEPGTDLAVVGEQSPATLFRTDDPAEIVRKATEVATALTEVLRNQNLISTIQNREHVRVEGWTLCGTMLGVFPVCVWSRKITGSGPDDEGWEARVEARTLGGAVIGAAEAQCMRSENQWSWNPVGRNGNKLQARDDYALRSMAQTRATSKALRQPLGFIVQMAGFETTPAEEMPAEPVEPQARRAEGPAQVKVPTSWPGVLKYARTCDNPDESQALYEAFLRAATYHLYGEESLKAIAKGQRHVMLQKASGAVCWLVETDAADDGPFRYFTEDLWRQAWMHVLDGHRLEIPDYVPPEPPGADDEAERMAREELGDTSPYQ